MQKVKVTMFPDPIEVPDDEVHVLRAQGILDEDHAADPVPEPASTPRQAGAKGVAKKDGES